MFKVAETSIALKYPEDALEETKELKTDDLWQCLDRNFTQTLPFIEQTIDRWNSQTQVIGNLKKNKQSHFQQTIVSQVNSLLAQSDFRQRTIAKTQLKRDAYRVLGCGPEDLHAERDPNLFNDQDLY